MADSELAEESDFETKYTTSETKLEINELQIELVDTPCYIMSSSVSESLIRGHSPL